MGLQAGTSEQYEVNSREQAPYLMKTYFQGSDGLEKLRKHARFDNCEANAPMAEAIKGKSPQGVEQLQKHFKINQLPFANFATKLLDGLEEGGRSAQFQYTASN